MPAFKLYWDELLTISHAYGYPCLCVARKKLHCSETIPPCLQKWKTLCAQEMSLQLDWHFPYSGLQSLPASSVVISTRHESRQMHQSRLSRVHVQQCQTSVDQTLPMMCTKSYAHLLATA